MSCRRSDHTHLVSCKIGDVGLHGCSRGCCWYPDSEIEANTRDHFLTSYYPPEHNPLDQPHAADRTGLYYPRCQSSYRPKFICARPTCRRSIKPSYDPDRHEYRIDNLQNWEIRPLPSQNPGLAAAFRARDRSSMRDTPQTRAFRDIRTRYFNDPTSISAEEHATLKAGDPDMWWTELISSGQPDGQVPATHNIRCPSCGNRAVRVGPTFEVPPKKDNKRWRNIERMIECGEDLAASFSSCVTVEEHKEMVEEALRLREREKTAEAWSQEKQKRLVKLGLLREENKVDPPSPSGLTNESS